MNCNLSQQLNIGKDTEAKLIQVGIDSFEKLQSIGSQQAFLMLQTIDPGACLSLLSALEGAIQGVRWHSLSTETKQELKLFFDMAKKNL